MDRLEDNRTPATESAAVNGLLMPSPEEQARFQETQEPGYEPPPPEKRPLPEKVGQAAKAANTLLLKGKKRVLAREVAEVMEGFGWKARGSSNNGTGDLLGGQGLRLPTTNSPKGRLYEIPKTGITAAYLESIGFEVEV